jgi:Sigma-70, region 4
MQSTLNDAETESVWRQLAPLLEDAMSRLSQKERTLVALQFFENKTGAETAALLGINEWAARKRIERAMDKLQKFFSNRGINSTTATSAGAISANSVQAAPIGLAKTATAVALAKGAAASASTLTLIKGALKVMAWTKAKTALIVSVGLLLGVGTATVLAPRVRQIYIERDPAWISVTNASGVAVSNVIFQGKHFSTGPVDLSSIGGGGETLTDSFRTVQ